MIYYHYNSVTVIEWEKSSVHTGVNHIDDYIFYEPEKFLATTTTAQHLGISKVQCLISDKFCAALECSLNKYSDRGDRGGKNK